MLRDIENRQKERAIKKFFICPDCAEPLMIVQEVIATRLAFVESLTGKVIIEDHLEPCGETRKVLSEKLTCPMCEREFSFTKDPVDGNLKDYWKLPRSFDYMNENALLCRSWCSYCDDKNVCEDSGCEDAYNCYVEDFNEKRRK